MTNDDIANSEHGEDLENKRTKYKIFQSIICNFFFTNSCLPRNRTPILVLRKNVISNFIFPIRVLIQRLYCTQFHHNNRN